MTAEEMEVLLEVGGFDMDGGVELTLIQTYIDFQKCDRRTRCARWIGWDSGC